MAFTLRRRPRGRRRISSLAPGRARRSSRGLRLLGAPAGAVADGLVVHGAVGLVLPVPLAGGARAEAALSDRGGGHRQMRSLLNHGSKQAARMPGSGSASIPASGDGVRLRLVTAGRACGDKVHQAHLVDGVAPPRAAPTHPSQVASASAPRAGVDAPSRRIMPSKAFASRRRAPHVDASAAVHRVWVSLHCSNAGSPHRGRHRRRVMTFDAP
jgi:hypothetical protein